jgi:ribosomal protein S4
MVNDSSRYYTPRLRRGILKKKRLLFMGKDLIKLKKKKWLLFLKKHYCKAFFLEPLVRNDVLLCFKKKNRVVDLKREYARIFLFTRQLSAFFRTLKKKFLQRIFLKLKRSHKKLLVQTFFCQVELRLDTLLVRSLIVKSFYHARWLVSYGFVFLNKVKLRIISFKLIVGSFVGIKHFFLLKRFFFNTTTFSLPPEYLEINYNLLCFLVIQVSEKNKKKTALKQYSFFFSLHEMTQFLT